jgi:aldehyde:ferredoxin oxidoreductase
MLQGKILDRDKFISVLEEYYRLRGWDEEKKGVPQAETLAILGLDDLVFAFQ